MNTDQNLLFGVLALELELIDVQQFAELCCTWAAHKENGLADLLVERNWISAEERGEVQRLMDRKLHRKQGDARQALSDAAGPQLRDVMRGVGDAAVEQTLSQLEPVPGFVRASETGELAQGEISHYTLSRVQDQGGLGIPAVAAGVRQRLPRDRLCPLAASHSSRPEAVQRDARQVRRSHRAGLGAGQASGQAGGTAGGGAAGGPFGRCRRRRDSTRPDPGNARLYGALRRPAEQGASFSEPGGWIGRGGYREAEGQSGARRAGGSDERDWDGGSGGRPWPDLRRQKNLVLAQEACASVR